MFRILFYGLIIIMIIRLFNSFFKSTPEEPKENPIKKKKATEKRVGKDVGEYVDFEEVKGE